MNDSEASILTKNKRTLSLTGVRQVSGNLPGKQKGVALMIVYLVFALVSILSVGMYNRQAIFVQQASNSLGNSQAYEYAVASEIYGRRLLKADWDEDKEDSKFVDDLEQLENSILIPIDDSAILEAQFNDVQGKLNLNDLVNKDGTVNTFIKERFERLFNRLSLESIKVDKLIDWIDENQEPNDLEGVEDGDYLILETPYRTSGQSFVHISELLLIADIERVEYESLLPHVTVLPRGSTPVNVNTASKEVIQSLVEGLDDSQVDELLSKRKTEPWEDIEAFLKEPVLKNLKINKNYMGVNSEFFEIATRIALGERVVRLVSTIYRSSENGEMTLISRDQGQKYLITKEKVTL